MGSRGGRDLPGGVHLQPGSEHFQEDTPGDRSSPARAFFCLKTDSIHLFPSSGRVGAPALTPSGPFLCVSGASHVFLLLRVHPFPVSVRLGHCWKGGNYFV